MPEFSPAALAAAPVSAVAQELKPRDLPPPRSEGGQPLTAALKLRRSTREYSDRPLAAQVLSDLLWAAFGINRPASGDRTDPYWRHVMVIDIYLVMADGVWMYEPKTHKLLPYLKEDFRALTGLQDFVATAPLNLVYVAHGERMTDVSPEERRLYASVEVGFIGQNVYLFCASEGLATVFRGAVDGRKLGQADGLLRCGIVRPQTRRLPSIDLLKHRSQLTLDNIEACTTEHQMQWRRG
jgi:nitroreductase